MEARDARPLPNTKSRPSTPTRRGLPSWSVLTRAMVRVAAPIAATLALFAAAAPAYASQTSKCSDNGYYGPIAGYNYVNEACVVWSDTVGGYGWTYVQTQRFTNPPAGYMAAYARIYKEGGALCLYSGWAYSNGGYFVDVETPHYPAQYCGAGNYYSRGQTAAWNGSAYDVYATFNTPYLWE